MPDGPDFPERRDLTISTTAKVVLVAVAVAAVALAVVVEVALPFTTAVFFGDSGGSDAATTQGAIVAT